MEQKIARRLNWYYYGMMVLTLVVLTILYFLTMKGQMVYIDNMSTLGKTIQYVVILDALISIPLGLYGFKRVCYRLIQLTDSARRYNLYRRYAAIRIVLVSNAMIPGILAYYLLGCYQSMLWVAAVAAIGWFFTKPTARKIQLELTPPSNQETY